jgi:hypothetical protein
LRSAAGQQSGRAEVTPLFSCSTFTIRSGKGVPEKALSISGADRFGGRGGYLPTTRDIHEPTVSYLGLSGGIVKHGGMSVRQRHLSNQLACLTRSTTKLRARCRASAALAALRCVQQSVPW